MKKFLFLAVLLTFHQSHAGVFQCSGSTENNCKTYPDFIKQQRAGCGGPSTICRRSFCAHTCIACPNTPEVKASCQNNCLGIVFTGTPEEIKPIYSTMQRCPYLGNAASYSRAVQLAQQSTTTKDKALALKISQTLFTDYRKHIRTLEHALSMAKAAYGEANESANRILEAAKASGDPTGQNIAKAAMQDINREVQQLEGTYVYNPNQLALNTRRSRGAQTPLLDRRSRSRPSSLADTVDLDTMYVDDDPE
jgi:hypothetical protein